jgi:hypothetical protein
MPPGALGGPSQQQQQNDATPPPARPPAAADQPESEPAPPGSPSPNGSGSQHPFVQEMLAHGASLARTHRQYRLGYRVAAGCAFVCGGGLAALQLLDDGSCGVNMADLLSNLNPFDSGSMLDVLPSGEGGRSILVVINLLFLLGLAWLGDSGRVATVGELAARYSELADEAAALEASSGLSDDALAALVARRATLESRARFLASQDTIGVLLCRCCGGAAGGYHPLDTVAVGSASLPAPAPLPPPNADAPPKWYDAFERATGWDVDGDGTIAGVPRPPPKPAQSDQTSTAKVPHDDRTSPALSPHPHVLTIPGPR